MEQDRFASNGTLYIIGIFCLIVCLSLFFFSMYIAPYLIWDLKYDIPEFILQNIEYFQEQYEMTENASRFLVDRECEQIPGGFNVFYPRIDCRLYILLYFK